MLVDATLEDIEKYKDFAYTIALNPAKSSYPTYGDGIKTKTDFIDAAERAVTKDTSELLLFFIGESIEGWISYDWISEDKYLQLTSFNINRGTEQALAELLSILETRFAGYTAYFGYPSENHDAINFLQASGFQCIEKDWNHSFFFDGYTLVEDTKNIEKISRYNFDKFRAVYHADPETYWNCDRIFETIDDWSIFVYSDGDVPVASVFFRGDRGYFEIYGIVFANETFQECVFRELLVASLNECKRMDAKFMTFFCREEENHILAELGFRYIGSYVLYIKTLI